MGRVVPKEGSFKKYILRQGEKKNLMSHFIQLSTEKKRGAYDMKKKKHRRKFKYDVGWEKRWLDGRAVEHVSVGGGKTN